MARFLVRRLFFMLLVLLLVTVVVFSMSRIQGDPRNLYLSPTTTQEQWEAWGHQMGLDRPLAIGKALRGDLGNSLREPRPVTRIVLERYPATLQLGLAAWIFAIAVGWPLGVLSAIKRTTVWDYLGRTLVGQSFPILVGILAVNSWSGFARQVRGETLRIKQLEYIALAKIASASTFRILTRHVFPGVINTAIVLATLQVGSLILTEAILSFLGAGIPPPTPAWGSMVSEGRLYLGSAWWIAIFPGIAIFLTVFAFNFLGDWLRDRLDPRLRQL